MTRALVVRALSEDLSTLKLEARDVPAPRKGEVKVRLRAASVNFPDILMVQGKYQLKPELPFSPGMEGAGDVAAVGEGVSRVKVGDKVVVGSRFGTYAEEIVVPEAALRALPAGFDYAKGAAYPAAYLTAYVGLVRRGALKAGETVLVHGAAGGVGLAAVDLGKLLGATVIATASTDEKRAFLKSYGADHVLAPSGFRETVKELTQGRGADVIYDPVGGDLTEPAFRSIGWRGRHLVIGFAQGQIPAVPLNLALLKGASIVGVFWGDFVRREPASHVRAQGELARWYAEGKIKPVIDRVLPLSRLADAYGLMTSRRALGKVIVTPD